MADIVELWPRMGELWSRIGYYGRNMANIVEVCIVWHSSSIVRA